MVHCTPFAVFFAKVTAFFAASDVSCVLFVRARRVFLFFGYGLRRDGLPGCSGGTGSGCPRMAVTSRLPSGPCGAGRLPCVAGRLPCVAERLPCVAAGISCGREVRFTDGYKTVTCLVPVHGRVKFLLIAKTPITRKAVSALIGHRWFYAIGISKTVSFCPLRVFS